MRALNSQRQQATTLCTLVSILIVFILDIHGTHSRSVVPDDQVIDKSLQSDGQLDTALKIVEKNQGIVEEQTEHNDAGKSMIDSGDSVKVTGATNDEGIRRFDSNVEVEVEESNKAITSEVIAAKPTQDDIITKVITVNDQAEDIERLIIDDSNQQKRSVQSPHDPIDDDIAKINAEHIDEGAMPVKLIENVNVKQIPELIPVAVDHVDIYQNISPEVGNAKKSLINVEDEANEKKNKEEVRNERSHFAKDEKQLENINQQSKVQQLKEQALLLQGQLKNNSFLQRLKEQAIEVLPDIPKFTENQLLQILKTISSKKHSGSTESYIESKNTTILSENELEIFKCAEGLVAQKQRQTFSENIFECVRGLSILNCMRIFIWPIIVDNVPESISQNFPTLPIELSISDLIPGNREKPKNVRATTGAPQQRLITPELVVANILKDALESNIHDDKLPTYIDSDNETLVKLLTPGQIEILKTAEKFLPESAREEYSNSMYSCVRRFEYFSCIKYFAWPMIKQHFPALPEFPDYQSWYPSTISVYPDYPILPFTHYQDENGELPEVVEADAIRNRSPRPETIIVDILKNTLDQQSRQPMSSSITPLNEDAKYMTAEQLKSIQIAEQLIPDAHRAEFIAKTMECIKQYGYLSCTKHLTWPTIREHQPRFPNFPDLSSWFGTYTNPQFSDLISLIPQPPSLAGLIPSISVGGSTQTGLGSISGSVSTGGGGQGGGGSQGNGDGQIGISGQGGGSNQGGGGGNQAGGGGGQISGGGQGGSGGQITGGGQGGSGGQISGGSQGGSSGQISGSSTGGSGSTGGQSGNPGGIIIIIPGNGQASGSGGSGSGQIITGGNTGGGQISGGGNNGGQQGTGGISWTGQGSQGGNTGGSTGGGSGSGQGGNNGGSGGGISAGGGAGINWGGQGNQGGNTGSSQPGNGGINWGGQGTQGGNTGSGQSGNGGTNWGGQGTQGGNTGSGQSGNGGTNWGGQAGQGGNTGSGQSGNGGINWGGQGSQGGNTGSSQPSNGGISWGGQGNQGGNTGGGQNGNGGSSITIIIPGNSQISNGGNSAPGNQWGTSGGGQIGPVGGSNSGPTGSVGSPPINSGGNQIGSDPGNQWGNTGSGQIGTGGRPTGSGSGTVSVPIGSPGAQAPGNQWGGSPSGGQISTGSPTGQAPGNQWGGSPGSGQIGGGVSGNAPNTGGIPTGSPGGQAPGNQWGGSPSGGQISTGSPTGQAPGNQWGGSPSGGQISTGSPTGQAPGNQWGGSPGSGQIGGGVSGNAPNTGGIPTGSPGGQAPGNQWGGSPSGGQISTGSPTGQAPSNQWGGSPGSGQIGGGQSGNAPSTGGISTGSPGGQAPGNQWGGSPGSGQIGGGVSGNAPNTGGIPTGSPGGQAPGNQWGGSPSGGQISTGSPTGQAPGNQWGGSPGSGQIGGGVSGNAPSTGGIPTGSPGGQAPGNQWVGSPSGGQISTGSPTGQAPSNQWGGSPGSGQIGGGPSGNAPSTGGIPTGSPGGQAPGNQWGGSPGSGQIGGGPSGNAPSTGGIPTGSPGGQAPGNQWGGSPGSGQIGGGPSGNAPSTGGISTGSPGGQAPGNQWGGSPGSGQIGGGPSGNAPSTGGIPTGSPGGQAPGNQWGGNPGSGQISGGPSTGGIPTAPPSQGTAGGTIGYPGSSGGSTPSLPDNNPVGTGGSSPSGSGDVSIGTPGIGQTGTGGTPTGSGTGGLPSTDPTNTQVGGGINPGSATGSSPIGLPGGTVDGTMGGAPIGGTDNSGSPGGNLGGDTGINAGYPGSIPGTDAGSVPLCPCVPPSNGNSQNLKALEPQVLSLLSSLRYSSYHSPLRMPYANDKNSLLWARLSKEQLAIMGLATNLVPHTGRRDLLSRSLGCLQGGAEFIICAREVIWPYLGLYLSNIPEFPSAQSKLYAATKRYSPSTFDQLASQGQSPHSRLSNQPFLSHPFELNQANFFSLFGQPDIQIAARSPLQSGISAKSNDDPIISVTGNRFVPIFSDQPEAVILNILNTISKSTPQLEEKDFTTKVPEFITLLNSSLSEQQENIMKFVEKLLPETSRGNMFEEMVSCIRANNDFMSCTRDAIWPKLSEYFPQIPNFPVFQQLRNDETNLENLQPLSEETATISETNVKTGHHGDAMVTITDTRFVPIYNDHPEDVILKLLTTLQTSNKQNEPMSFIVKSQPFAAVFTEQQSKILSVAENLIPGSFRLAFMEQMNDCVRINNFLDCTRDIVWPVMGQFYPRLSTYPNFNSLPSISEGMPHHPTLLPPHHETNDYSRVIAPAENQIHQIPHVPNYAGHFSAASDFSPLGQLQLAQHSLPLRTIQASSMHPHISIHPGITSSVGTAAVVPGFPGQPTEILLDISQERVPEAHFTHTVRKRRSAKESTVNDTQIQNNADTENLLNQMNELLAISNLTEPDVIELLNKLKKSRFGSGIENHELFFVESSNSSVIQSLTPDQIAILKMVEQMGIENARGVVSQVLQCITGLSFIRCIGIFILPLITGALPTLNLPFGRSKFPTNVEGLFNAESIDAVEKQLLDQKKTVENILVDWYKQLTEEKYTTNYGFLRFEGHGNGEIGVKFTGLRNAKGIKIKDTKNLPSILTIISDIMEDVLDSKPDNHKPKKDKKSKSIEFKSDEILEQSDEFHQRSNDEKVINMFLEKLKPNNNTAVNGEDENRYLTVDDAYRAFEVLFGTKMRARFINKLERIYQTSDEHEVNEPDEKVKALLLDSNENKSNRIDQKEEKQKQHHNQHRNRIENADDKKKDAALVFQFPRIHENVEIAEKITSSIADLSRRMKNNMVQMMPGLGFVVTFFIQVAMAHARAAASVASLISNMALGSAVMTLMQQTLLSSRIEPKIKHVYVNEPETDPGMSWSP